MKRIFLSVLSVFVITFAFGQSKNSSIKSLIASVPPIVTSTDSAYRMLSIKQIANPYDAIESQLKNEFRQLAAKAGDRSYLIAQLAGTYKENVNYFAEKSKANAKLVSKREQVNADLMNLLDDYTRAANSEMERLYKSDQVTRKEYEIFLVASANIFNELLKKSEPIMTSFDRYLAEAGFNSLIELNASNNSDYIPALESKAFLFNKVLQFCQIARGSCKNTSLWMEACKKNPASCK